MTEAAKNPMSEMMCDIVLSAAKDNKAARIATLLEQGVVSPDCANQIGQSMLHIAALWGSMDVVRLLVEAGADVRAQNRFGATALHCAAMRAQMEAATYLIAHGADVAAVAGNGLRPYEMCGDQSLWAALGAPSYELHNACKADEPVPALLAALSAYPALNLDDQNENGDTPLAIVVRRAHAAACALLLERGAKVNVQNREGRSALHLAASLPLVPSDAQPAHAAADVVSLLRVLIDAGGDPTLPTRRRSEYASGDWERREADGTTSQVSDTGLSCLHLAVEASGDIPDVVEFLFEAGAPIDAREGDALATPLHAALEARHLRVAVALLRRGADVALGNRNLGEGSAPLHDAAQRDDLEVAQLLVGARADVDQPGRAGMRPLHMVARTGSVETARYLLDAGARVDLADARGRLPADYAAANPRQSAVCSLLREAAEKASVRHA